MAENYYLLTMTEDGDVYLECYSKERLLKRLNTELEEYDEVPVFFSETEGLSDLRDYCGRILIKGEVVVPKPVKVVKEYEVD